MINSVNLTGRHLLIRLSTVWQPAIILNERSESASIKDVCGASSMRRAIRSGLILRAKSEFKTNGF